MLAYLKWHGQELFKTCIFYHFLDDFYSNIFTMEFAKRNSIFENLQFILQSLKVEL